MNKRIFFAGSKNGFTLAEVLIVLTIIGIIAAITIPIVISSINNQKFITGLQKANNTFSNVINASQADVKMESWDFSKDTTNLAKTYIVPYLNVAKNCENGEGCFASGYTFKDGSQDIDYNTSSDYYKIMTTDGVSIAIKGTQGCTGENLSVCIDYIVDTNGVEPPNKWGKDVHAFQTLANLNAVVPYGTFKEYDAASGKWILEEQETATSSCLEGDGKYCALKIINDGWEIKY